MKFIMSVLSGGHPLGMTFGQVTVDDGPFFTHLFIDEAAQATEPEILCPISCVFDPHLGGRKVEISLIGDPRQLSPRVYASDVADSLGRSIVERILRRPVTCLGGGEESLLGPTDQLNLNASSLTDLIRYYASVDGNQLLSIFLTENYRGHPSFLMIPSALFYYDRLRSVKKLNPDNLAFWRDKLRKVEALSAPPTDLIDSPTASPSEKKSQIHRQTTWPIHFRGVMGKDSVVGADSLANFSGTDSWENFEEATVVVDIVSTLKHDGVLLTQIGVMTPFRGQVAAIRRRLREKLYYDVNVGTIENYQAVEQDVIILSLTRANKELLYHDVKKRMGVFGQPKQVNVAMTRAENLYIVVGNPNVMWDDPCWRQFLRFCLRNGLWYGCGLEQKLEERDLPYVSTIDLTDKVKMNSNVVVSTLEKIHRFHWPDQCRHHSDHAKEVE
jgi:helicase MOV-10